MLRTLAGLAAIAIVAVLTALSTQQGCKDLKSSWTHLSYYPIRDMRATVFVVETQARLAELDAARGRPDDALARAEAALRGAREAGGLAPVEALLHRVIGVAYAERGDVDDARAALDESLAVARRADAPYEVALTLDERARLLDDADGAREAESIFESLGVSR